MTYELSEAGFRDEAGACQRSIRTELIADPLELEKQHESLDEYVATHEGGGRSGAVEALMRQFAGFVALRCLANEGARERSGRRPLLLDVGCGIGREVPPYARELQQALTYVGLDPFERNFERDYLFICGVFQGLHRHLRTKLDYLLFSTSLDHLPDLEGVKREIHATLAPSGLAFFWVGLHDPALVARVELTPGAPDRGPLFDAIARRHTNRGAYADAPPSPGLESALRALVDEPAVSLHWLATPELRARFREQTVSATEAIVHDAEMSADSERWYRHSSEDIARDRDGTTLDATGNGAVTRTFGKALGRPSVDTANEYWLDATRGRQTTGSAFVILSSSRDSSRADQLRVGRIYQRLHLWATAQGLAMQPLNQLAERQDREESKALEPRFTRVLAELVGEDRRAQMLFRIGYPWDEAFASPRRPLAWVLA